MAPAPPARGLSPHARTGAARPVRRLLFVSAGAIATASVLYIVTVGSRTGQLVGELILGGRPADAMTVAGAEQILGSTSRISVALGTSIVVVLALLQRRPRLALAGVVIVVGANVTTQVLKQVVLDRSDLLDGLFYPLANSFPSGHATAAASLAVALLIVLPPLLRAPTVLLSALVVAMIGISTLVAGWHRMADAVGGVFVATAWGAGLAAALAWQRGVEVVGQRTAEIGKVSATLPLLAGSAMLVLGGLAYLIAAVDPLEVLLSLAERGGSPALFGVGVVLTVGTSLVALGALGWALRDIRLDPPARPVAPGPGQSADSVDPA